MKYLTTTLILLIGAISAEDCADDPNGTVAGATCGAGSCDCATLDAWFGCGNLAFSTIDINAECPHTCNKCPGVCGSGVCEWDETYINCPDDCTAPSACVTPVCLNITNVHPDAQTFDVIMKNQAGCKHYEGTTEMFTTTVTEAECSNLPTGAGSWFDGNVAGFQLVFSNTSMTITSSSVTGGSAIDAGFTVNTQPNYDDDNDGTGSPELSMILGYTTGATIPAGEGALVTVAFTGYTGDAICFNDKDCAGDGCDNLISDAAGIAVAANWGDCYCTGGVVADCAGQCGTAALDACGVCGGTCVEFGTNCPDGSGNHYCNCSQKINDCLGTCGGSATEDTGGCCTSTIRDCAGVCNGTAPDEDTDGVCDSDDTCPGTQGTVVDNNGCSTDQLAIVHVSANIPAEFTISQNYPNPFNPITSITFDVAAMDEISLVVYDLSGKEVITLATGTFMPGSYLVNWDAVNNYGDAIASGMYVYRYISSDKAITRKMLYLK